MRIGDRVAPKINSSVHIAVKRMFEYEAGIVTAIHNEWNADDPICWDVTVMVPSGETMIPKGFYFSDLEIINCINGIDDGLCGDETCRRCVSIAFESERENDV